MNKNKITKNLKIYFLIIMIALINLNLIIANNDTIDKKTPTIENNFDNFIYKNKNYNNLTEEIIIFIDEIINKTTIKNNKTINLKLIINTYNNSEKIFNETINQNYTTNKIIINHNNNYTNNLNQTNIIITKKNITNNITKHIKNLKLENNTKINQTKINYNLFSINDTNKLLFLDLNNKLNSTINKTKIINDYTNLNEEEKEQLKEENKTTNVANNLIQIITPENNKIIKPQNPIQIIVKENKTTNKTIEKINGKLIHEGTEMNLVFSKKENLHETIFISLINEGEYEILVNAYNIDNKIITTINQSFYVSNKEESKIKNEKTNETKIENKTKIDEEIIEIISPINNSNFTKDEFIQIVAKINDDINLQDINAKIKWENGQITQKMIDFNNNNIYETDFFNAIDFGKYNIQITANLDDKKIKSKNTTFYLINETKENKTNNKTKIIEKDDEILLIKNIPNITLFDNEEYIINLYEYFNSSEDLTFLVPITNEFDINIIENKLHIKPKENLFGKTNISIVATNNINTIESNFFEIKYTPNNTYVDIQNEKIRIGKNVSWTINIENKNKEKIELLIPKNAKEIIINERKKDEKIKHEPLINEVESKTKIIEDIKKTKTISKNKLLKEKVNRNINLEEKSIQIAEEVNNLEIKYKTSAPQKIEEKTNKGKKVIVYSDEEYGYENIISHTNIDQKIKIEEKDKIKLFWIEEDKFIDFLVNDTNNDGFIDYIEWIVPHLSTQTFEIIIEITSAHHLDSNKTFIEDIYEQVFKLDDIWSSVIKNQEYIRVTFEKNLTNKNDITIFPKIVSGNPIIEIYEIDSNEKLAEFKNIKSNEYNKVYLTNLIKTQNSFDLKIINGSIEFDHIIDPTSELIYNVEIFDTVGTHNWTKPEGIDLIDILIVGGGGAGGSSLSYSNAGAGGGGAGGLIYIEDFNISQFSNPIQLKVGKGGIAPILGNTPGENGENSTFANLTAIGGGGGAGGNMQGNSGGSGGGSRGNPGGISLQPGSISKGFGNRGGNCPNSPAGGPASGGGGAESAGEDGSCNSDDPGTKGGDGLEINITGIPTYYAGGGGGGAAQNRNDPGVGGLGGGGTGGNTNIVPTNGIDGLGGGGGGGNNDVPGANGGSGIIIIKYIQQNITIKQPKNTTAGQTIQGPPSVKITTKKGEPKVGKNVTVELIGGNFSLGTTTKTTNTSGIAVFDNLIINKAGTYRLNFIYEETGKNIESDSFTIQSNIANNLSVIVEPQNSLQEEPIRGPPTIQLVDKFNNSVKQENITITATINDSSFTSESITTVNTNSSGISVFNNLIIPNKGLYEITFSATDINSTTTNSFSIIESGISFIKQPTNTTAGETIDEIVALYKDNLGNPIAGVDLNLSVMGANLFFGTTTKTTNESGMVVYDDLIMTTAGSFKLQIDSSISEEFSLSNKFSIFSNIPKKIIFIQQPSNTITNNFIQGPPTLKVVDEFLNGVQNEQITIKLNDSSKTLLGTTTKTTNNQGIAEFENLIINQKGNYTLNATLNSFLNITNESEKFSIFRPTLTWKNYDDWNNAQAKTNITIKGEDNNAELFLKNKRYALNLSGLGDYLETTATASDLNIDGAKPRTVSVWANTRIFDDAGAIFSLGTTGNNGEDFSLRTLNSENNWRAQFWGSEDINFDTTNIGIQSFNEWTHFTITYDGTEVIIYVNGTQIANELVSLNTVDDETFKIGWWTNRPETETFDGIIHDVRVYDRVLTETEVNNLASGEDIKMGLTLHLPMLEGEGTTTSDISNNNYDAIFINNPKWIDNVPIEKKIKLTKGLLETDTRTLNIPIKPNIKQLNYTLENGGINITVIGSPKTINEEIKKYEIIGQTEQSISWQNEHENFKILIKLTNLENEKTSPSFNSITLQDQKPTNLSILVEPTNTTSEQIINPPIKVSLLDEFAQPIVGKQIDITLNTGNFFSGTTTKTTNNSGTTIFDDLAISTIGTYTLNISSLNLKTQSKQFNIIKKPKPNITIHSPINAMIYNNQDILVNISVEDENLNSTWYNFEGTNETYINPINITFPEGQNTLHVWANNTFGSINHTNVTFTVKIDNFNIDLISPIIDSATNINASFKFNVTNNNQVNNCSIYIDDELKNTSNTILLNQINTLNVNNLDIKRNYWFINCSDETNSIKSNTSYFDVIDLSEYDGITTNMSQINTSNIENFYVEKTDIGRINFTDNLNLSGGADINNIIKIEYNNITINTSLDNRLNKSAILTFNNLPYKTTPNIFKNNLHCDNLECQITSYNSETKSLQFNVSHFTSYTTKENTKLTIWDETDIEGGNLIKYIDEQVKIFANYTDYLTKESINGTNIFCEISFNDTGVWSIPVNMTFNNTHLLYEHNRSFQTNNTFYYNISCNGQEKEYEPISLIDSLIINFDNNIYFIPPTPNNYQTIYDDREEFMVNLREENLSIFNWNFDETKYSIYNNSLKLMLNLNNNANLGESSNTAIDISNNKYSASITDATYTNGKHENALLFNGGSARLRVPSFQDLNSKNSATISAWVKQNTISEDQYFLWAEGNVLIQFGDSYNVPGASNLRIRWHLGGDWGNSHTAIDVLNTNEWNYWTFVFDSGDTKIYKNGVNIYNGSDSQTQFSSISPNYDFGTRTGDGLNGVIDEIRIYDKVLTDDEILMNYYSNLNKINNTNWQFYSKIENLKEKQYSYYASFENNDSYFEKTETRFVNFIIPNSRLEIWDDTDITKGGQMMFANESINFYANYTNITDGSFINGTNVNCNINFTDKDSLMEFNETTKLYEYNRSFDEVGEYNYTILCNGSILEYDILNKTNTLTINEGEIAIRNLILESDSKLNHTTDNLTCSYEIAGSSTISAINWFKNNKSISLLNMPFEGNSTNALIDYSTNNNNGEYFGNSHWNYGNGLNNNGNIVLDGTNDWIRVNHSETFSQALDKMTIEAWIYDTASDTQPRGIISKRDSASSNRAFSLFLWTGRNIYFDVGSDRHSSTTSINANTWNHVAIVFDGTVESSQRKKFYINGEPAGVSSSTNTQIPVTPADIYIGILDANYGDSWQGRISNVRIYNDSLSYEQIKLLHENKENIIANNETKINDELQCSVTAFSDKDKSETLFSNKLLIDDKLPKITLITPEDNYITEVNLSINITFNATVTDDYGLNNCSLWHNYTGIWHENKTTIFNYNNYFSYEELEYNLTNLKRNKFIWNIYCYDNNSQLNYAENRTINIIDTINPSVFILDPTEGANYLANQKFEIIANVTDNDEIMIVRAKIEHSGGEEFITLYDNNDDGIYNATYNPLYLGRNNITILARDLSNNLNDTKTTWFNISYDTGAAIYCENSPCIANESLIISRDSIGGTQEPNQPNTIDDCTDGTSGTYMSDESIDHISVKSLNGSEFRALDTIEVNITAYCYDGTSDNVNFIYGNDSENLNWKVMDFINPCPAVGFNTITRTFILDNTTGIHAFRGSIQYQGTTTTTCGSGSYDDNDDLEFLVLKPREENPPTVEVIIPENKKTYFYNDIIPIQVNVTDKSDITEVYATIKKGTKEWRVDLYDYNLDDIFIGEFTNTKFIGNYSLKIYATDEFDNINNTEEIWFMVNDTGTLIVKQRGCIPSIIELNDTTTCHGYVNDENVNISNVLVNVTMPNGTIKNINPIQNITNETLYYFELNNTSLVGNYLVNWWANNTNSISREDETTFFAREYINPSVKIITPLKGTEFNTSDRINITINATDDTKIQNVTAKIIHPNLDISEIQLNHLDTDIYSNEFTDTRQIGNYSIQIIATDTSGNINNTEDTWVMLNFVSQGAIYCENSPCIADESLIISRDNIGGTQEPNQPNTIDDCTDGTSGTYMSDESIDHISVKSLNGSEFRALDTIEVNITAYCYDGTSDNVNFIYGNDSENLNWKVMDFINPCPAVGFNTITRTFVLDNKTGIHAFRGSIQYQGSTESTCGTGEYDDNDDLEFLVLKPREKNPPKLEILSPLNIIYTINDTIEIKANVTDQTDVITVYANVSWDNNYEIIQLQKENIFSTIYTNTFTNTNYVGEYSIEFFANDTFNNINNTEAITFNIDKYPYNIFYGNATANLMLGFDNNIFYEYNKPTIKNIYAIDIDSNINYDHLIPIGRNIHNNPASNDFYKLDVLLNLTNRSDSIKNLFATDNSTPKQTDTFNIYGRVVENVPIINSTNNSNFITGILWDSYNTISEEFDINEKQNIVFITKYNEEKQGKYGIYGYEIKIPYTLGNYSKSNNNIVFYKEIY
ncbi:MAG: LamG-like jellyroll fold domain-containing protein [Candidatus Woesearchaeota archaeon]